MGGRTFLTKLFLGAGAEAKLRSRRSAGIRALPDRRLLADAYIPAFAKAGGRILWIGCRAYTAEDYPALEAHGAEVWTTDIDPDAARWGRERRHRTGDVCTIDAFFGDLTFDAIVCNGVLGFGVDAPEAQSRALAAMAAILRPGGLMLLGWNTDKIDDPVAAQRTMPWFIPAPFAGQPARVRFDSVTHVYDSFLRTDA
ncbi:class I SAM-dependent methyltransferase [Brevundimonas kwangchunensis]|uniref:Class I SAM-dependent methyltransferase n=1 Tax=Brevundimonas kwangchunensis TaxID=322163 RepID=A0ABP3SDA9_9CAUL